VDQRFLAAGRREDPRKHGSRPRPDAQPERLDRGRGTKLTAFERDIAQDGEPWRHSNKVADHTFSNILGKDCRFGSNYRSPA
jgi:hypothetical protein